MQESELLHIIFASRETFCIILLKSVFNKYHNNYYYNIFLEKYLYQLANI